MTALLGERTALEDQVRQKTQQINAAVALLDDGLTQLGGYVETTANKNATPANPAAAQIESAGMNVADSSTTPVGPMPKVTGLSGTPGDDDGEVDLHWNPKVRGCSGFIVQRTTDPAALTGWTYALNCSKSKCSLTGLTSATREWFRVAALGTAGQGPWSDPVQVTIP